MKRGRRVIRKRGAFSLIEILVAMAILAFLVVLLAQIMSYSSSVIGHSRTRLEATSSAEALFSRMARDFAARLVRSDMPLAVTMRNGNDEFRFFSEVHGYEGDRTLSLVGYRVQESTADRQFQAERGAQGASWNQSAFPGFSTNVPTLADDQYEIATEGIFRLEICYLETDGTYTCVRPASDSRIAAIVVAVAVLGETGRKILTPAQIQSLRQALPDTVEGEAPLASWQRAMKASGFASGIPARAVQSIDLYQRTFSLQ